MKNILVPTDFSDNADNAVNHAINLAQKATSSLHLVHTYQTTSHASRLSNINKVVGADRQKEMADYLRTKNISPALTVTSNVRKGDAVVIIEDEADKKEADFVVMGTLGAQTIAKKLFGSTTSNIIKNLNIPVLAIPAAVKDPNFDHIVVALDALNTPAIDVLDRLIDFVQVMDLKITLLHVFSSQLHTDLDPKIKLHLSDNNIDYDYKRVEADDTLQGILDFSSSINNAMLYLVSRQRTWFGNLFHSSISQQVAMQTNVPLLVLHDADS